MKKILLLFTALLFAGSLMTVHAAYYVAHNAVLNSKSWNVSGDQMTQVGSTVIYYKTFTNIPKSTNVQFKVTDGSWNSGHNWNSFDNALSEITLSNSGGNVSFTLSSASNVTIYFNSSNKKIWVYTSGNISYTIAGEEELMGVDWNTAAASGNDMTRQSDGITWVLTRQNVSLTAGNKSYKVVKNHNWGSGEYPTSGNNTLSISSAGTYNVTFTYIPGTASLTATALKKVISAINYPASPSHYSLASGNPTSGEAGETINFTATPDENYFLTVTVNGSVVAGNNNVYSFTMPAEAATVAITATPYRVFNGSTPIYLKADAVSWWLDASAVQKATFTKADNTTVTVTGVLEEGVTYAFTPGAGAYKSVQFSRHNPSNVSEDWGHTDAINLIGTEANDYVTVFAQNSTNATWATFVPSPSYTFPAGTIIYYDLREYNGGVDDKDGVWHETTNEIFGITLASDWKVTASTKLFRSGPNNNWGDRTCATLPTAGQNIIVSADGITCHWDTYVPTYTVVGEVSGLDWDVTSTTHDMTKNGGVYTLEMTNVELAVGNYAYKIVKDHSYSKAYPQEGNASLSISEAGIYDLTFTLNLSASPEYSVTPTLVQAAVVIPTVVMNGTFANGTDWASTPEFTVAGNNESASLTIENLPAGNYEFKVIVGSSWLGNGETFYRDYTEAANIGDGGNMTLEADVAGNYTFTWTYETNALSIEFPDEPTPEYVNINFFAPRDETNKWEHVYAYSYKGSRKFLGEWPGTEITNTKNAGWYTVSVRKGSNLIFTDYDGMQTNDIMDIQAAACYESTSIYYPAEPTEAKKVTVTANANCEVAYYIAGSKELIGGESDFGTNAALDENNQIVFHDVMPGTYSFKINNGTWAWALGGNDHLKSGDCQAIAQTVGVGDVGFKIDTKQDVTITYYPETQEICLGAVTVKATGEITADNMSIEAGESKSITYWTNNTDAAGATFTIVSGGEYILLNKGVITGIKSGETVIRIAVAETANYTEATKDFTVTITAPADPGVDPIALIGGKFIINAKGDTAVFSRGNLQYQQSSDTWRCAPNQYEWKGMGNLQMGNAEYEGWVDLFSWSLGAENNYGATSAYLSTAYHNKSFVDWGTKFEGDWATLSSAEWKYLLNTRSGANDKWGMAMIDGNLGMILLPDEWSAPAGVEFVPRTNPTSELWDDEDMIDDTEDHFRVKAENMPANKFTLAEWAELEAAGAIFLPYAGRRSGGYGNHTNRLDETIAAEYNYTYYENYLGTYWTSTMSNPAEGKADYVYTLKYQKINNEDDYQWGKAVVWGENGRYGQSVRLVHIIPRQYGVTYTAGEGEGTVPTDENKYLDGAAISLAAATGLSKDGYKFAGWKFKGAIYNDTYTINNVLANEEIVFEAQWELDWQTVRENLTDGWYYTMCLEKAVAHVQGASIWRVVSKAANGNDVILEEVELPLDAGRPYIFNAAADKLEVVYSGDAVGAPVNDAANNGLIGSFSKASIAQSNDNYIIYDNELYYVNSDNVFVGDHRAYLHMADVPDYNGGSAAPGRRRVTMTVHGEQVATGMESIQDSETPVKKIIDGNLYILRGEKMFDATGRLVK